MITGEYDKLDGIRLYNLCAEHQRPLTVAWHAQEGKYVLRCGEDHYPDAVVRDMSLTERYKAGEELPEPIKSNVEKGIRRRAMTQGKQLVPEILGALVTKDLGNDRVLLPEQVVALVQYAETCGLDATKGHVVVMYGKPYITIDGYLYHSAKVGGNYQLKSRPLSEEERSTYRIPEEAHAWTAEVMSHRGERSFTGMGIVTMDEMTAKSTNNPEQFRSPVVAKHPWQLAQKRAEWQALRRAFPIGLTKEQQQEVPDDRD